MQLHPYQAEGVAFALKHRNCMIADEMGLGKTVQAIGYINANPEIRTALIVCPLSLKINWWNEVDAWLTREAKDRCVVTVVHYEGLAKLRVPTIDLLVCDEAQLIKNPKTARYQAVKKVVQAAKHFMMLTGTPFENRVIELWPLLQLLKPEVWDPAGFISKKVNGKWVKEKVGDGQGANFMTFAKRYCGAKQVTIWKKVNGRAAQVTHWDFTGATHLDELKDWLTKTGVIRRLKSDVLRDLPPKTRQLITLPSMPEPETLAYYRDFLEEDNFAKMIEALHQDKIAFTEWSAKRLEQGLLKVDYVVEHVTRCIENGQDKIILFAYHREVVARLAEALVWSGCVTITAEMSASERQDAVDIFTEDPNCKVIIGGISTMGVGYTLTVADLVVFAEIDPVPGRLWQAEDRAHRITQERPVFVHYLIFDGTIDARICKIAIKKQSVMRELLG